MPHIRTGWFVPTEAIQAAIEQASGRQVASIHRTSGLYVHVVFADDPTRRMCMVADMGDALEYRC